MTQMQLWKLTRNFLMVVMKEILPKKLPKKLLKKMIE